MLGKEPTLIEEYVRTGKARLQFWHILDHAKVSLQASAAAECAGQQGAFWRMHGLLFENQDDLWGADLAVLSDLAVRAGADGELFGQCMASGEMQNRVREIDGQAKTRGVRIRPTFDVNEQRLQGSPALEQWRQVLDSKL